MDQPRFLAAVPALPVSDERRAVAFLARTLGMAELEHEGRGIGFLVRDGVQLQVWVPDGSAPGAERELAGTASCRIEVTGIDELYRRCLALGAVHPNGPLADRPWGTREFAVLDPDHNLITLYQQGVSR